MGEPCAMAQHLPPPVPENKGHPVRVPPVTSAPEHLGSTPRHKGASVQASLHWGSVGGSSFQGSHVAWQVALAILPAYPWEGVPWKEGYMCGEWGEEARMEKGWNRPSGCRVGVSLF